MDCILIGVEMIVGLLLLDRRIVVVERMCCFSDYAFMIFPFLFMLVVVLSYYCFVVSLYDCLYSSVHVSPGDIVFCWRSVVCQYLGIVYMFVRAISYRIPSGDGSVRLGLDLNTAVYFFDIILVLFLSFLIVIDHYMNMYILHMNSSSVVIR